MKSRGELAPDSVRTIAVRLVRITTEITTVSVPINGAVTRASDAGEETSPRLDPEKLFAEAARIAARPGTRWQRDGEPHLAPHTEQPPLFDTTDLIRRG